VPQQTFLRLVKQEQHEGGVFGPDELTAMTRAIDQLLLDYKLTKRNDPLVEMLVKLVIELVRNGERGPETAHTERVISPDANPHGPCAPSKVRPERPRALAGTFLFRAG
jgi:hypothetical protein